MESHAAASIIPKIRLIVACKFDLVKPLVIFVLGIIAGHSSAVDALYKESPLRHP